MAQFGKFRNQFLRCRRKYVDKQIMIAVMALVRIGYRPDFIVKKRADYENSLIEGRTTSRMD